MAEQLVTTDIAEGIADIRFNRPDKHNSLNAEMFEAIAKAAADLHARKDVRVAILSGNGASFCAGLDFSLMQALLGDDAASQAIVARLLSREDGPENLAQRVAWTWRTAPIPVIAAIHGAAFGGGFQIAMACDIRIAAPEARFSIMEMRYGLIPDMSITQTLPEHLPRDVALELTLSAREFDAAEARHLGLVTQIADDPRAAAHGLAETICQRSPQAVRAAKQLYNEAWRSSDAATGLALEARLQVGLIGSDEQREAVSAALQKRAPQFGNKA